MDTPWIRPAGKASIIMTKGNMRAPEVAGNKSAMGSGLGELKEEIDFAPLISEAVNASEEYLAYAWGWRAILVLRQ